MYENLDDVAMESRELARLLLKHPLYAELLSGLNSDDMSTLRALLVDVWNAGINHGIDIMAREHHIAL